MTLSPSISRDVRGVKGDPVPPAVTCANPACLSRAQERHHLWRRSQLAGVYDWVMVDGRGPVRNVIDLCRDCHRQVTENKVWIEFLPDYRAEGRLPFLWHVNSGEKGWVAVATVSVDVDESVHCPTCGQRRRAKRERPPLKKRKSKSLTISVPDDAEDGAEVFDTLVEALCEELGYEGAKGLARYHAALAAMHFTLLNKELFLRERSSE